ncbi:hypothetical protein ACJZ2D_009464 [Fusarium nematophilum]
MSIISVLAGIFVNVAIVDSRGTGPIPYAPLGLSILARIRYYVFCRRWWEHFQGLCIGAWVMYAFGAIKVWDWSPLRPTIGGVQSKTVADPNSEKTSSPDIPIIQGTAAMPKATVGEALMLDAIDLPLGELGLLSPGGLLLITHWGKCTYLSRLGEASVPSTTAAFICLNRVGSFPMDLEFKEEVAMFCGAGEDINADPWSFFDLDCGESLCPDDFEDPTSDIILQRDWPSTLTAAPLDRCSIPAALMGPITGGLDCGTIASASAFLQLPHDRREHPPLPVVTSSPFDGYGSSSAPMSTGGLRPPLRYYVPLLVAPSMPGSFHDNKNTSPPIIDITTRYQQSLHCGTIASALVSRQLPHENPLLDPS